MSPFCSISKPLPSTDIVIFCLPLAPFIERLQTLIHACLLVDGGVFSQSYSAEIIWAV